MNHTHASIVLSLLSVATCSYADFITLDYLGHGRGSFQSIQVEGSYDWNDGSAGEYYYLDCSEKVWTLGDEGERFSHCIQIYAGIPEGSSTYEIVDIADAPGSPPWPGMMGQLKAVLLQDLYAEWVDPATGTVYSSAEEEAVVTAFQILTWEITHENYSASSVDEMAQQVDLELGAIKWASDGGVVANYVTDMISLLRDGDWSSAPIVGLSSDVAQDQAFYVPGPGILFGMGVGLTGLPRRRRH